MIRKQLGLARKRLSDRMKESSTLMQEGDVSLLKIVRSKLQANVEYHSKLNDDFNKLTDVSEDEQIIIDNEIEVYRVGYGC